MRRLLIATGLALLAVGLAAGAWFYLHPSPWAAQFAGYRVGAAQTYSLAKPEIAAFDSGSGRTAKDRELAAGWGTGNQQFDFYLARYLGESECSDDLRQAFSLEFGWRPELLPRWAHFWAWRTKQAPEAEIASIIDYLEALAGAEPPRLLTWREVLDLQAVFTLTGKPELARRLTPDNWSRRFAEWSRAKGEEHRVERSSSPFPDWRGPVLK